MQIRANIRYSAVCGWILMGLSLGIVPNRVQGEVVTAPTRSVLRKPVPINMAEAIIEPFWAPDLSGFRKWRVDPGPDHGLRIKQNWSAVDFEWASKPKAGPALRMRRDFQVDCSGYDRLLVRAALPRGAVLHVTVQTDKGLRTLTTPGASEHRAEHALDLEGASCIHTVTLAIEARAEGHAAGWLRWIGLDSRDRLAAYLDQWDYSGQQWDAYIRDRDEVLRFEPRYGIFLNAQELATRRTQHEQAMQAQGESETSRRIAAAQDDEPEQGIHEFVKSGGRTSAHSRVRDKSQPRLPGHTELAVAGLVARDAGALRLAARYALCLALSRHWDTGFMSHLPGSAWEDRAFRRSYTATDIAMILDLAGEVFTEAGRAYLMRRLSEEGIGPINYVTWRHEYIFHCNQLAYFNTGRMYGYLVLEREWPRVKPYTDLAYADALDNLASVIEPDGGTLEGPGYFNPIARENYKVLKYYARARGLDVGTLLPPVIKRTADYAAAIASTTADDVIPVCDSGPGFRTDTLTILAEAIPGSYWATLYHKHCLHQGLVPPAESGPAWPAFMSLPDIGYLASTRPLGKHFVKLLIMGNKAGAGHTHEDKGSFVLEYAGQSFAMDLGICDYDDPVHTVYKHCQRHNMLVPVGVSERAHPQNPLPFDVKPTGRGDEHTFHARIDATPGWRGYYRKWIRSWDSPSPGTLVIRDAFELSQGNAVELYWQTNLPVTKAGRTVTIQGVAGTATLSVASDCTVRIEPYTLVEGTEYTRIAIRKEATRGTLEVSVHLQPTCKDGAAIHGVKE